MNTYYSDLLQDEIDIASINTLFIIPSKRKRIVVTVVTKEEILQHRKNSERTAKLSRIYNSETSYDSSYISLFIFGTVTCIIFSEM